MAPLPQQHDLLRKRLERFTRLLPGVDAGEIQALHRTRVASRRLRELLPVLQLEHDDAEKIGKRIRKVRSQLGTVRELDVLLMVIDELHESGRPERAALRQVSEDVKRDHAAARERLLGKRAPSGELHKIAKKLGRVLANLEKSADGGQKQTGSTSRAWKWALEARIAKRANAVRHAIDSAGAVFLPDRLHELRIAVKKLRYAVELSAEADGLTTTPELKVLRRCQDILGRINDFHVLMGRVRRTQAALNPPNVLVWRELESLNVGIENQCRRLHGRYMRERPALEAAAVLLSARAQRGERTPPRRSPRSTRLATRAAAV